MKTLTDEYADAWLAMQMKPSWQWKRLLDWANMLGKRDGPLRHKPPYRLPGRFYCWFEERMDVTVLA